MGSPSYVTSFFSDASLNIICPSTFDNLITICLRVSFWFIFCWNLLSFWNLDVYLLLQIKELFSHYFFPKRQSSLFLLLGQQKKKYILVHLIVSQKTFSLFSFFFLLLFLFAFLMVWVPVTCFWAHWVFFLAMSVAESF